MLKKLIIFLICILIIIPCFAEFTAQHKKRNIKLKLITHQIKIGYETDSAIIYLGKNDIIKQLEKLCESRVETPSNAIVINN